LRRGLVGRLSRARSCLPTGFDLLVLDGWRSIELQRELIDHYRRVTHSDVQGFVADPGDDDDPPHTTGGAVDLTLSWQGLGLALGT
jgi:D-alanyl-D-alanine dipeptidase